jgi:hypothetical protein
MNEVVNVEQLENEISIIEQNHHNAILSIHDNMNELIVQCDEIVINIDDKKSYDNAVELKRKVKNTHVAIEKKRKELKQPLIDYGKRLDKWVEHIYNPLVQAEKVIKKKMDAYEENQQKIKQERKLFEEQEQKEQFELENRLKNLNAQLEKINGAKTKKELKDIETYLDSIIISEFGSKSHEAGFILNQLKLTCSMASRLMKDEEEKPVESVKLESTPISNELVEKLKEQTNEPNVKIAIEKPVKIEENQTPNEIVDVQKSDEKIVEKDELISSHDINKTHEVKDESTTKTEASETKKASEEDVINMIDKVSSSVINEVIKMVDEKTKSIVENSEFFDFIDFAEHKSFIHEEVKKRVGVLLKK